MNIGILGAGEIVEKGHLPVLLSFPEVRVAWILDKSVMRLNRLRQMYRLKDPALITDQAAASRVDIILVALPFAVRSSYASLLSDGIRGVYLEKPLFATAAEHRAFLSHYEPHAVAHGLQRRHTSLVRMLHDVCRSESLGLLRAIEIDFGGTVFLTAGRYFGITPQRQLGIIFETGTHWVDIAAYCCDAVGVESATGTSKSEQGVDLEIRSRMTLQRQNGSALDLRILSTAISRASNTMRFQFDSALLELNPFGSEDFARVLDRKGHMMARLSPLDPAPTDPLALLKANWTVFFAGLAEGRATIASAATSVVTTEILEACHRLNHA